MHLADKVVISFNMLYADRYLLTVAQRHNNIDSTKISSSKHTNRGGTLKLEYVNCIQY